jgi:hypothetical protein
MSPWGGKTTEIFPAKNAQIIEKNVTVALHYGPKVRFPPVGILESIGGPPRLRR